MAVIGTGSHEVARLDPRQHVGRFLRAVALRPVPVLVVALVLLVALATAVALTRTTEVPTSSADRSPARAGASISGVGSVADLRKDLSGLGSELQLGAVVAAPTRWVLSAGGALPQASVVGYGDPRAASADVVLVERDGPGTDVTIVTPLLARSTLLSTLPLTGVQVRQVSAPASAVSAAAAAGTELAENPALTFDAASAAALRAGAVDDRVLVTLATLAASHTMTAQVATVETDASGVHRTLVVTRLDGVPATDPQVARTVAAFVAAQNRSFASADISDASGVAVRFRLPLVSDVLTSGSFPTASS